MMRMMNRHATGFEYRSAGLKSILHGHGLMSLTEPLPSAIAYSSSSFIRITSHGIAIDTRTSECAWHFPIMNMHNTTEMFSIMRQVL